MVNFPASLDTLSNPTASTLRDDPGFELDVVVSTLNDIAEALEAKVGTGASTPTASTVLRGTGTGTSAFGQIATGDVASNAITQSAASSGSSGSPTTTSATPVALNGMSVSMTTTGGPVVLMFSGVFYAGAAATISAHYFLDTVDQGVVRAMSVPNSSSYMTLVLSARATPSAASHTFEIRWSVTGGVTATADSTNRTLLAFEMKR